MVSVRSPDAAEPTTVSSSQTLLSKPFSGEKLSLYF